MRTIVILMLLFFATRLSAQNPGFYLGMRAGFGQSIAKGLDIENPKEILMPQFGLATQYQFEDFFAISLDVLYTSKGGKNSGIADNKYVNGDKDQAFSETLLVRSVEFPLLFKLSFPKGQWHFKGYGGPCINVKFDPIQKMNFHDANYNVLNGYEKGIVLPDYNRIETATVYGIGADFTSGKNELFFVDLRICKGHSSIATLRSSGFKVTYSALSFGFYIQRQKETINSISKYQRLSDSKALFVNQSQGEIKD